MFMLVCNKNKTRKKSANKKQNEVQHNQHDHQSYPVSELHFNGVRKSRGTPIEFGSAIGNVSPARPTPSQCAPP